MKGIEAIIGSLIFVAGTAITVVGCGGYQKINWQNYLQVAEVCGGLLICGFGGVWATWGAYRPHKNNNRDEQEHDKYHQDNYVA